MKVREAPAIGVAAAYGIALEAQSIRAEKRDGFLAELEQILKVFSSTRSTAVNLFKAIERMREVANGENVPQIKAALSLKPSKYIGGMKRLPSNFQNLALI